MKKTRCKLNHLLVVGVVAALHAVPVSGGAMSVENKGEFLYPIDDTQIDPQELDNHSSDWTDENHCYKRMNEGLRCPIGIVIYLGDSRTCDSGYIMQDCSADPSETEQLARLAQIACNPDKGAGYRGICQSAQAAVLIMNKKVPDCTFAEDYLDPVYDSPICTLYEFSPEESRHNGKMG